MKFFVRNKAKAKGSVFYRAEEYSFDTSNGDFENTTILVNDVNMGINADTDQVVQLWGFSSKSKWIPMDCAVPPYREGSLIVSDVSYAEPTRRLNSDKAWNEYYNASTGWLCIDSGDFRYSQAECVHFIDHALALISNQRLVALWIKV